MADQDFLASYGVQIDEEGVQRLHSILDENRQKAGVVAEAFGSADTALRGWLKSLNEGFSGEDFKIPALSLELDLRRATASLAAFMSSASSRFRLSADASGLLATASSALDEIRSMFAGTRLRLKVEFETENPPGGDGGDGGGSGGDGSGGDSGGPKMPGPGGDSEFPMLNGSGGMRLPDDMGVQLPEILVDNALLSNLAFPEIILPEMPEHPDTQ